MEDVLPLAIGEVGGGPGADLVEQVDGQHQPRCGESTRDRLRERGLARAGRTVEENDPTGGHARTLARIAVAAQPIAESRGTTCSAIRSVQPTGSLGSGVVQTCPMPHAASASIEASHASTSSRGRVRLATIVFAISS